jgi:hypothetical protein
VEQTGDRAQVRKGENMSGIEERIKEDKNWLERLLDKIPGIKGYKQKEIRREGDKIQRSYVGERLGDCLGKLDTLKLDLTRVSGLDALGEVDVSMRKLRKVRDRIQFADYGYTGMMDPVKVGVVKLDELMAFDKSLETDVAAIGDLVGTLGAASPSLRADMGLLNGKIDALDARFSERELLITGAGR